MGRVRQLSLWIVCIALLTELVPGIGKTFAQSTTAPAPALASPATTQSTPAAVVVLKGRIDEYSQETLLKRIDQAKAAGAKTIILELDTPGGLVLAAQQITGYLREQKEIHTVAFVNHRALSAGIMIGLSCDELVMSPGSFIGDCAPIMMSDDDKLQTVGATERAKMESPILADFYASSVRNGYDPLLTASMVTMNRVVRYLQSPDGTQKRFVDEAGAEPLIKEGWKPVEGIPDPVDKADTLLTVDSNLAAKLGLSRGTYASPEAFAAARGLSIAQTLAPRTGERVISWLGSPAVRGILIVILLQAIYFAFGHPGHLWPELIGIGTLLLLLGVPMMTGYANWLEVLAIIVGLVLLALEVFVIPGFGVTGIAGLILVFGGLVMTFVGNESTIPGVLPSLPGTWINLQRGLLVVTLGLLCSLVLWFWLNRYLPKLPYFNKLILSTPGAGGDIAAMFSLDRPVETGPAIGDVGIAVSDLRPGGSVKFMTESYPDGRIAAVVSDSGYVPQGSKVIVREVAGNRVVVRTV